jgi:hypothetical protein
VVQRARRPVNTELGREISRAESWGEMVRKSKKDHNPEFTQLLYLLNVISPDNYESLAVEISRLVRGCSERAVFFARLFRKMMSEQKYQGLYLQLFAQITGRDLEANAM